MSYLRLLLVCALFTLAACEKTADPAKNPLPSQADIVQPSSSNKTQLDIGALAKRYAERALTVVDVSEVQLDGASTLSVSFSAPLDPEQKLAEHLRLVDKKNGAVDGAWELSDNLMTVYLRHLEPKRELIFTADASLRSVAGKTLGEDFSNKLQTNDVKPLIGFASRGSLLPTRQAEGLPVIALNIDKVNVEFFRIKAQNLPQFLSEWGRRASVSAWQVKKLTDLSDLVYSARFDLNPKRNVRETLQLPIAKIKALQAPGVYLALMRGAGDYDYYSIPATIFSLSDIGLSARRYQNRLAVLTQALEGGKALSGIELEVLGEDGQLLHSTKTDKAGFAELPYSDKSSLLLARQGGQTSVLPLKGTGLDLSEFNINGQSAQPLQFFVFGPRDLYRPGETVLLNALLRDADGKSVAPQPVTVEVRKPDGETARTFVWNPGEDGLYHTHCPFLPIRQPAAGTCCLT